MRTKVFSGVIILAALCFLSGPAAAQSKIGYVDSQKILENYPAAVDARKKLEDENIKWSQELQKLNEELKAKESELDIQSLMLSDAKKKEKQSEIRVLKESIQKFQNDKWGKDGEYFKWQEEFMRPVYDRIHEVIAAIAEDENFDYVLDTVQGSILFSKVKYDLTDKVLAELEKEVPAEKTERK